MLQISLLVIWSSNLNSLLSIFCGERKDGGVGKYAWERMFLQCLLYDVLSSEVRNSLPNVRLSVMYSLPCSGFTFCKLDMSQHISLFSFLLQDMTVLSFSMHICTSHTSNIHSNWFQLFNSFLLCGKFALFSAKGLEPTIRCFVEIHKHLKDKQPIVLDCSTDHFSTIVFIEVLNHFISQGRCLKFNSISYPMQVSC